MDSTIPQGAPRNPFKAGVEEYANFRLNYHALEYQKFGKYTQQSIPQQIAQKMKQSLLRIQNMLMPTIRNLANQRNITQLQTRIYRKMKTFEEQFNQCQKMARNTKDAYYCGNQFIKRLDEDVTAFIKTVLDEY